MIWLKHISLNNNGNCPAYQVEQSGTDVRFTKYRTRNNH